MKTREEIAKELDSNIPVDVISERSGGSGKMLSYLEGWYVIDRLNKVLGQGNWFYTTDEIKEVHKGTVKDKYGNDVHTVHYIANVRLEVKFSEQKEDTFRGNWINFTDYGYGDGSDKINPGKAHELAVKEAVTDGLKRCAKNLGMSLGLALYDKSREFVGDPEPVKAPVKAKVEKPAVEDKTAIILEEIKQLAYVLEAKKKMSRPDLKAKLKSEYGVDQAKDLSSDNLTKFYNEVQALVA